MKTLLTVFFLCFSYNANSTDFELSPIQVWSDEYNQSFQQIHPVNRIKKEQVLKTGLLDINRALEQQTGVQVQHEDAWGLRPNIGIRGTPPHRSRKISFYEDGVLIGPAPYSAPAAYYTPHIGRIESVEIYKGLSSLLYGPNTVGGAIEYITRPIQTTPLAEVSLFTGSFNTTRVNVFGSTSSNESHALAVGADLFQSDGFKQLDGGGLTGFNKVDAFLKYQYQLPSLNAYLKFKIGHSQELSHETYLGLTIDDFNQNPYRRYLGSKNDLMTYAHNQINTSFYWLTSNGYISDTQLYHHSFNRNWQRLNNFSGSNTPSIDQVLRDPTGPTKSALLDLLKGNIESQDLNNTLLVRANNDRYFISQGLQTTLISPLYNLNPQISHKFKAQARLHYDQIDRQHTFDDFAVINQDLVSTQAPRIGTQNLDSSQARSISGEWSFFKANSTFILSHRSEWVDYQNFDRTTLSRKNKQEQVHLPGVGFLYNFKPDLIGFVSLSRAATLTGPQSNISEQPEQALVTEVGFRSLQLEQQQFIEALFFQTDYQNMQGICSFSSGCLDDLDSVFTGGKALIQGVELKYHKAFQLGSLQIPIEFNSTLMQARFTQRFLSTNPEWGTGWINAGDLLPYVPQVSNHLSIGLDYKKINNRINIQSTGTQADQSVTDQQFTIPAYTVIDFSTRYNLGKQESLILRVDNIFNSSYLVSLRPFGARPGKPQTLMIGYQKTF